MQITLSISVEWRKGFRDRLATAGHSLVGQNETEALIALSFLGKNIATIDLIDLVLIHLISVKVILQTIIEGVLVNSVVVQLAKFDGKLKLKPTLFRAFIKAKIIFVKQA